MKVANYQYYMTIDESGLKFAPASSDTKHEKNEMRLHELNNLGLRFVMAISLRHQVTDLPVVVAIFERQE